MKKLLALGATIGTFVALIGIGIGCKRASKLKRKAPDTNETKKPVKEEYNIPENDFDFQSKKNQKYYYIVICKVGHVGQNNYTTIAFPIYAENGKEAAKIARSLPRVKHNQKDAIISCKRVSKEIYEAQKAENSKNPFLHCVNRQQQRPFEEALQIFEEHKPIVKRTKNHSLRNTKNFLPKEIEKMCGDIGNLDIA